MTALPTEGERQVWRPPMLYRVLFGSLGALLVVGAFTFWDGTQELLLRIFILLAGAGSLAAMTRSRMELGDRELILRHTLTTRTIPLTTLVSVTPGQYGLTFETASGACYGSPPLIGEKAPLLSWMRRRSKADGIADTIMAARPDA